MLLSGRADTHIVVVRLVTGTLLCLERLALLLQVPGLPSVVARQEDS